MNKSILRVPGFMQKKGGDGRAVFLAALGIILLICFPYINTPPVWDAAEGAFAPAAYLYEQGDLFHLIELPGYQQGGPNTNTLSFYTAVVYWSMEIFNGSPDLYIPFLHILSILVAALVVLGFYLLLRDILGHQEAILSCLLLITFPLFLVQASYVYMGIYGALFSVYSILLYVRKYYWLSLLLTLAALSVKSIGLFTVAGFVGVMMMDYLFSERSWRVMACLVLAVMGAMLIIAIRWQFNTILPSEGGYLAYLQSVFGYISDVPDLFVIALLAPISFVSFIFFNKKYKFPISLYSATNSAFDRVITASIIYSMAYIGFTLTVGLSGKIYFPMPRYYVWVVPAFMICSLYLLSRLTSFAFPKMGKKVFVSIILLSVLFFSLNVKGVFYPYHGKKIRSFSVVERSFEYANFFNAQYAAVKYVDQNFSQLPVFTTRGEYYFMSTPLIGYVENDIPNLIMVENLKGGIVLPEKFVLVSADSNGYHGQDIINRILKTVMSMKGFSVKVFRSKKFGPYRSEVYFIEST